MTRQAIKIDEQTALEICTHEAIVRQTYYDSEGVPTWSIGLTNATGHNVERYWDKPQPMEHCLAVFVWALQKYADEVLDAFEGYTLSRAQFAAALSFHWNTGKIGVATWVRLVKDGKMGDAANAFMRYNKPAGIIGRRRKECDLFFKGKWAQTGKIVEYGVNKSHRPDWSSAQLVDIRADLRKAFAEATPQEPVAPTKTAGYNGGLWDRLKKWLVALFS